MAVADCYEEACRLLARREHSLRELRSKLGSKGFEADELDEALERLIDQGLQSDARYAAALLRSRMQRGQGPLRIRRELADNGLDSETIATLFETEEPDWWELAREVRVRKFAEAVPSDYKEKARQMRFLQYRGFDMEQIRYALGED